MSLNRNGKRSRALARPRLGGALGALSNAQSEEAANDQINLDETQEVEVVYSGRFPIDHLDEAIILRDEPAILHFFGQLSGLRHTHETLAGIVCKRNEPELLKALFDEGFWPSINLLRELISVSAASGSSDAMGILLDMAVDRGIEFDQQASGWVNALAGRAGTGSLIQHIHMMCPWSVGDQAVYRALEEDKPETLTAILECLMIDGSQTDTEPELDELQAQRSDLAWLAQDCLSSLSADTATALLKYGLDPASRDTEGVALIERVFNEPSVTAEVRSVFEHWIASQPDGKAMYMYVLTGQDKSFEQFCERFEGGLPNDFDAQHALSSALSRNHVAMATALLSRGASAHLNCETGLSPLFIASAAGSASCVQLLLDYKADPDKTTGNPGVSCLCIASANGHGQIVQMLLQAGADVRFVDEQGYTALHYCAAIGDIHNCLLLLDAGLMVDVRNVENQHTPLLVACILGRRRDQHEVIRFLVEQGADITATDAEGVSAIELASMSAQGELVQMLLECGANPKIRARQSGAGHIRGFKAMAMKMRTLVDGSTRDDAFQFASNDAKHDQDDPYDRVA